VHAAITCHMHDPPRSETATAAALPLQGGAAAACVVITKVWSGQRSGQTHGRHKALDLLGPLPTVTGYLDLLSIRPDGKLTDCDTARILPGGGLQPS
jgi:hypothetical protein